MEYTAPTRFNVAYSLPAAAGQVYYRGRLLAVDVNGRAAAALDEPGLIVVGRIEETVDNSTGLHGDAVVPYRLGAFAYRNSGTDPVTQAVYGRPVFIEDDITIRSSPGDNNIFAGFFRGFDERGDVWVDTQWLPMFAAWFGNNPNNNWRLSVDPETGGTVFQLWNQDAGLYQTIQIAGAPGAEHLVIA